MHFHANLPQAQVAHIRHPAGGEEHRVEDALSATRAAAEEGILPGGGVAYIRTLGALEKLKGDRSGQHSIRINDQWRICFVWRDGGADNVEMVDYH